jgi:hypothetical protein
MSALRMYVDTSAFYALEDVSDDNHRKAIRIRDEIGDKKVGLLTSNFVMDETLTLIRIKLGHDAAVNFGKNIRKSKIINVVHVTEEIEEHAWMIFVKYQDKDFSFTDCTSFEVMKKYGVKRAFTFDDHFKQIGFEINPE